MGVVNIETDVKEAVAVFDGLDVNRKKISEKLVKSVASGAKTHIKRNYGRTLKKVSGELYREIRLTKYNRRRESQAVTNTAEKKGVRYGWVLAAGATIEAKNREFLTFKVGDKWYRKHSVTIQSHDFIEGPGKRWVESPQGKVRLEKEMEKQTAYWIKRLTEGKG